jgi:uncharacterized protein (DUF1015 family)
LTLIRPFRALRAVPLRASEILAPPYDVLTSTEARERARNKPWSFLHISKPEIDLDPTIDPHDPAVYAKAAETLARMIEAGVVIRDEKPCYYVYRLSGRGFRQTGLAAVASLAHYHGGRIRKHEHTTPLKEDDRVRQIEALNAQTGPVMMAYPPASNLDSMLLRVSERPPDVDALAEDGIRHELWVISDDQTIDQLTRAVDGLPALYIGDGHHRSAAAARVSRARAGKTGAHDHFLAVLFPHHEMTILDYNRVVRDLNGRTPDLFFLALREKFSVLESDRPVRPTRAGEFGMYLGGQWYQLTIRPGLAVPSDPIERLPITLLSRHVIEPLLGITDPRSDNRIDFVGGGRGPGELERLVATGEMAVAFSLYPTQMDDLMAVADAGGIMPPKSTWFEPKLADGMVNHVLD